MSLTVKNIADKLDIDVLDTLDILKTYGINVVDPNRPLSKNQEDRVMELYRLKGEVRINNSGIDSNIIDKEKKAKEVLQYCTRYYKVFIDTCSLMHDKSEELYNNIRPFLKENNTKLIVPTRVIEELLKHKDSGDIKRSNDAKRGINIILKLQKENLLDKRGEASDNFADNVFLTVFTKFKLNFRLLLITQDKKLSIEILELNNSVASKGYKISVKKINKYGYLSNIDEEKRDGKDSIRESNSVEVKDKENEKFSYPCRLIKYNADTNIVTSIPSENDIVYTKDGCKIMLINKLASGGEGIVYSTDSEYVAKIYKKEKVTKEKEEKIKLMTSKVIRHKGICWPIETLMNKENQFIGYLMIKAEGREMQKLFLAKPVLLKHMPNWKRVDIVELGIKILEKITYLHEKNIILGDINLSNILITSSKEVYFVDTDSYQVEGFACPVGTEPFTAREIFLDDMSYKKQNHRSRAYADYLRTFENEYFSIAVLLFMIMLPGKHPYSLQGGESIKEEIINMDFPYPLGGQSNKKTPDGPWKFIWSHLPYKIKEAFYNTFSIGGDYSLPENRINAEGWKVKMTEYFNLINSGKFEKQDEMSLELFPIRRKKVSGIEYAKCSLCGIEEQEIQLKSGICSDCLNKGEVYHCSKCSKEQLYTNFSKYIKSEKKKEYCSECYEYMNRAHTARICIECSKNFVITNKEYEFYEFKQLDIPKRCKECRGKLQNTKTLNVNIMKTNNTKGNSIYSKEESNNKGLCFITTAICMFFNKPDDCYELNTLRLFRDEWLCYEEDGSSLINEYYKIAPNIVNKLDGMSDKEEIYIYLKITYLDECLNLIEANKNKECKNKYIEMVDFIIKLISERGVNNE